MSPHFSSFLTDKAGRSNAILYKSQQQSLLQGNEELGVKEAPLRNHIWGCWKAEVTQQVSQKMLKNWRHFDHFWPCIPQNRPYLKEELVMRDAQNKPVCHNLSIKSAFKQVCYRWEDRKKARIIGTYPKTRGPTDTVAANLSANLEAGQMHPLALPEAC